ncbi:uncharacterized protein METZ01_LOCUS13584 [marine metagenome]|uniref:Uncharacterized protein n=1 Tax=marine metagenome TaxID=408172 RepID=A0A381P1K0_9ZZZZ
MSQKNPLLSMTYGARPGTLYLSDFAT